MKKTPALPAGLMALFLGGIVFIGVPQVARAGGDYCREYTRTVYIGGRTQDAYGTACLQPDGSWMIAGEGMGYDIPDNARDVDYIIHDGRRDFVPTRVVYVTPKYKKYRHRNRNYQPSFVWNHDGHYRNGHHVIYRDDHKMRGMGHRNQSYGYNNLYRDHGWNQSNQRRNDGQNNESFEIRYRYDD